MADKDFVVKNGIVVNTSFAANSTQMTLGTISASSNGLLANSTIITFGNSSVNVSINTTSFSGSVEKVGGNTVADIRSYSSNADNLTTGTVVSARLPADLLKTSGNFTLTGAIGFSGVTTHTNTLEVRGSTLIVNSSAIWANGAKGTAGQVLSSNSTGGAFWSTAGISGSDTQVQFNDGGNAGASAGFVFNKASNTITLGNTSISATINSTSYSGTAANATKLNNQLASEFYPATTNPFFFANTTNGYTTGATNPFNQNLNTTSGVTFAGITNTEDLRLSRSAATTTGAIYFGASPSTTKSILGNTTNGFEFAGTNISINGQLVLNATNYTTYTVTKTGTGASGDWGINITGVASGGASGVITASAGSTTTPLTVTKTTTGTVASFANNTTTLATLLSSGNLGIGNSAAIAKLHITGPDDATSEIYINGGSKGLRIGANSAQAWIDGVDGSGGTTSYQPLVLGGNGVFFTSSGATKASVNSIAFGVAANIVFNGATNGILFADGTFQKSAAGAVGGGTDKIFWENDITVTSNYTITTGKNAGSFGPITINSGITVTVPSGSVWSIV
jgi:hypothetical protein